MGITAVAVSRHPDRVALRCHADMIARGTGTAFADPEDGRALMDSYHAAIGVLDTPNG